MSREPQSSILADPHIAQCPAGAVVRPGPCGSSEEVDAGKSEAATAHELASAFFQIGNEAQLRLLQVLRWVHDADLYYELGYSSYHQYCAQAFGVARSTAYEYIRVAKNLDGLPRMRVLFDEGELSWGQVRVLTRVATAETEVRWIELAFEVTPERLNAEVRDARQAGRGLPHDRRHGLANLVVRLCIEMTIEERERVRAAFRLVSAGPGPDRGGTPGDRPTGHTEGDADPRSPIVRWADGILSGAIAVRPTPAGEEPSGSASRPLPAQTILYRTCPECRETTIETPDGPVCVSPDRVVELAAVSNRVAIAPEEELHAETLPEGQVDAPNSTRIARQVLSRDGLRCANPGCGRRRALHVHHIVHRADGGRTALSNLVTVCHVCHAMLHQGLLEIVGTIDSDLAWRPGPAAKQTSRRDAARLRERFDALVGADQLPGGWTGSIGQAATHPGSGPSCQTAHRVRDLAEGLVRLGWSRADGVSRVRQAVEALTAEMAVSPAGSALEPPGDEAILLRAMRA